MIDLNCNCRPCNPFTRAKCYVCIKSKLDALAYVRAFHSNLHRVQDSEKRDDVFSLFSEVALIGDDSGAAAHLAGYSIQEGGAQCQN